MVAAAPLQLPWVMLGAAPGATSPPDPAMVVGASVMAGAAATLALMLAGAEVKRVLVMAVTAAVAEKVLVGA